MWQMNKDKPRVKPETKERMLRDVVKAAYVVGMHATAEEKVSCLFVS